MFEPDTAGERRVRHTERGNVMCRVVFRNLGTTHREIVIYNWLLS